MSTTVSPVEFSQLTAFAGFDWATEKHDVVVLDPQGNKLLEMRFAHTAEGWNQLRVRLESLGKVGVAIETNCGPAVERLLDMGVAVYPLNPKAAERYRDRHAPSGVKDDAFDAWCFAEALRTEGQHWRILEPLDPKTQLLRILCRDEISMIEQRTALVLQLQAALGEYYPAALEAFDDWTAPSTWQFLLRFFSGRNKLEPRRTSHGWRWPIDARWIAKSYCSRGHQGPRDRDLKTTTLYGVTL